jgi:hypothetical protein
MVVEIEQGVTGRDLDFRGGGVVFFFEEDAVGVNFTCLLIWIT